MSKLKYILSFLIILFFICFIYIVSNKKAWSIAVAPNDSIDWSLADSIYENDYTLLGVRDFRKLFLRVTGPNLSINNTIYINTNVSNPIGFNVPNTDNFLCNYKIQRGTLYKYENNSWIRVTTINVSPTNTVIDYEVTLHDLNINENTPVQVISILDENIYLPSNDTLPFNVTTTLNINPLEDTLYPTEDMNVLNNPYTGFVSWASSTDVPYEHNLAYVKISWKEIEPIKGTYNWEYIEEKYNFQQLADKGIKLNLRIYLDEPKESCNGTENYDYLDIPTWLYDEINGDGTWYNKKSDIGGGGFSPNYSNPIVIEHHKKLMEEFGKRYDTDPRIAYIQLGSLGHWGEWHTWPTGSGEFPTENISNEYVTHYISNFSNKLIGMRKPYDICADNNLGLFNDMFGDIAETEEWIQWFNLGRFDHINNNTTSAMDDFWKYNYSGGEFAYGNALKSLTDDRIIHSINQAKNSHTTFLGPCSPLDIKLDNVELSTIDSSPLPEGHPIKENIDMLHKVLGYRFVMESITHKPEVKSGNNLQIEMIWRNKGVAPLYYKHNIELSLTDSSDNIVHSFIINEDITTFLPGITKLKTTLPIPSTLAEGQYSLLISINNIETNMPSIKLAINETRNDLRYNIGTITIK